MAQGRKQNRNRTITVIAGSLALVAVLAVGASALQRFLEDGEGDLVADRSEERSDAADGGELGWIAVETGIGYSTASLVGSDALYLVSTAPGAIGDGDAAPAQQAIYTSADGEVWDVTVLGSEIWVNDLTERDGTLYAIGTTPGTGPAFEAAVGVRNEDDGVWEVTPLPSDFTGIDGLADSGSSRTVSIVGEDTIVAAVSTTAWGDFTPLLPEGVITDNRGVNLTPDGVAVVDWGLVDQAAVECGGMIELDRVAVERGATTTIVEPAMIAPGDTVAPADDDPCQAVSGDPSTNDAFIVHEATWEELGLDGNPSLVEIYVSDSGGGFERVETDLPDGAMVSLFAAGDGFVALANQYPSQSAWYSTDGRGWTELPDLPAMDSLTAAGTVDDRIVVAGSRTGLGPVVAAYDDPGAAPQVIDVAAGVGGFDTEVYMPSGAVGDGMVVLAVSEFDMATSRDRLSLLTSADLESWTVTTAGEMIGDMNAQAGEVMVGDQGIYAQLIAYDARPNAPWRPLPLMAIAERG